MPLGAIVIENILLVIFRGTLNLPDDQLDFFLSDATAVALGIPSLCTIIHFFVVVLTTPPYRRYVLRRERKERSIIAVATTIH